MGLLFAWWGDKWVRRVGLALAAVAGLWVLERRIEARGARELAVRIEKKASTDAAVSSEVREAVAAGKRGKPDPHLRRVQ